MAKKFDYAGAKKEGYSDEEISEYLRESNPSFDYESAVSEGYSPQEINEHLSTYKPKRSKGEKAARMGAQYSIGNIERIAAPYDIAVAPLNQKGAQHAEYRKGLFEDIERLQEQKQMGQWDEQDQDLYDSLIDQVKNPEKAEKNVKTVDISSRGLIEKGSKKLGYDLKPEGLEEHLAGFAGNLFSPKNLKKGVEKGIKFLDKEARQAMKLESQWKSLAISSKKNPEAQNILNFAKDKGLTPEEATVLLKSHGQIEFLERYAKKSKKYKAIAEGIKTKLGDSYEELKSLGKQSGLLTESEKGALQGDMQKILNKIETTFLEGPDTKGARLEIEEAIKKIGSKGGTIEDLINSRQNLNQVVNWKKADPKGSLIKEVDRDLFKAIERKNPELAKQLKYTDNAYSKYKKFSKTLNREQPGFSWNGIKLPGGFMTSLAFWGALKFAGMSSLGAGKAILAKESAQRLATKLLTDPKYHQIHKKIIHAVQIGSKKDQRALYAVLKTMVKKDDPELYEEISGLQLD